VNRLRRLAPLPSVARRWAWQGWASTTGALPVPALWTAFVLGWLPGFGIVVWAVLQDAIEPLRLVAVLLALAALAGVYLELTLRSGVAGADLAPAGPGPDVVRRRLLLVAAMAGVVVGLMLLVPNSEMWWFAMYPIIAGGLALPTPLAAGVTGCLVGLAVVSAWLTTGRFDFVLTFQVAFGAGAIAIRQLTLALGQLRAARVELAHLAVAEERLRFARDLHDLLGHSLSVIVLKSELAGKLFDAAPARAAAEVHDVERAARDAMRQVRAAVAGYRQPALQGELSAAAELLPAAGIVATVDDVAGPLPPALDGLLAWAVREGVTNVIRHSRARRCSIRVSREDGSVCAEISDDGQGLRDSQPPRGSGLTGLAERAAVHGGQVQAGGRPGGGFCLVLTAPEASATGGGTH
jgi:two-component system, NarL family, sensor histidine kinase DesK